jgi:hypothetical protein
MNQSPNGVLILGSKSLLDIKYFSFKGELNSDKGSIPTWRRFFKGIP